MENRRARRLIFSLRNVILNMAVLSLNKLYRNMMQLALHVLTL